MADTKISALTILTGAGAAQDDVLAIVDTSALTTKKITREEFFKSIDYMTFDTTNVVVNPTEGQLTWDTTDKTLSLGLNGGDVVMQIGQETHYRIRNNSGATIPNGTVCRFAGSLGNSGILLAAPFLANGTYDSRSVMGVATEDIPNGADGLVTHFGKIRGVNTSAFTDGQILYASPTVAGGLTATKPNSPNNVVSVAAVVSSANNGTMMVRPLVEGTGSDISMSGGGTAQDYTGFSTRSAFVTWANGKTPTVGAVIDAAGCAYRYIGTGTAISGLPGWVPNGDSTPEHFGAVGDGVANDTAPCQAWALYGGKMEANGSYRINLALRPASGSRISGNATFRMFGDTNQSAFDIRSANGQSNIRIEGSLRLDGDKSGRIATAGSGILNVGVDNFVLSGIICENWPNAGVLLEDVLNATISNCIFRENGGVGLSNFSVSNMCLSDCQFANNGRENLTWDGDSNNADVVSCTFLQHKGGCGNIGIDSNGRIRIVGGLIDSGSTTLPSAENRNGVCVNSQSHRTPDVSIHGTQIQGNLGNGVIVRDRTSTGGFVGGDLTLSGVTFRSNGTDLSVQEATGIILVDQATRLNSINVTDASIGDLKMGAGISSFRRAMSANQSITSDGTFQTVQFTEVLADDLTSQSGNSVQLPFGGFWNVSAKLRLIGLTVSAVDVISVTIDVDGQRYTNNEAVSRDTAEVAVSGVFYTKKALARVEVRAFGNGGVVTLQDDNVTCFFQGFNVG